MKPEEFKAKMDELLQNHTDQARVSTILAEVVDVYNKESKEKATAIETADKLKADNETLRQANMNLFLKVGEQKPVNQQQQQQQQQQTPKYEDLFDEKGILK